MQFGPACRIRHAAKRIGYSRVRWSTPFLPHAIDTELVITETQPKSNVVSCGKAPIGTGVQLQSIRALRTTRQFLKALAYDPPYYGRTNLISKYWTQWLAFTISLADERDRPTAPLAQAVLAAGLITLKDEHKCSPVQHSVDISPATCPRPATRRLQLRPS